jgi:hypothetical protein
MLLLALVLIAAPASAQQLFDSLGQADVPDQVGGTLSMYSIMPEHMAPIEPPLPLDFDNFQYTLVVTGLTLDADGAVQTYSGGTITMYEDAGTAADYAILGSFTDGEVILSGNVTLLTRQMFTATIGTVSGNVDWTGGTQLNEFAPADQLGWTFLSGVSARNFEPGFDEVWDGKVEPQGPIVDTEKTTWGSLKALMR